jgi:hypothetical protein
VDNEGRAGRHDSLGIPGMTKKLAISVPDDVAARLDQESNVSASITEAVRVRIAAEDVGRP